MTRFRFTPRWATMPPTLAEISAVTARNWGASGIKALSTSLGSEEPLPADDYAKERARAKTNRRRRRKTLIGLLLTLLLPWRVAAADGPIARSVAATRFPVAGQYGYEDINDTDMRNPVLFWIGVGLVAGGIVASVGAMTWQQQSDLSLESPLTRLGRDLAPCGTDPAVTLKPIADCKVNQPLLWLGTGLEAAGGVLMFMGSRPTPSVGIGGVRGVGVRVRF